MDLTWLDLNSLGGIASCADLVATIGQWLASVKENRSKATIDDYLEWLRRTEHHDVLARLESSADALDTISDLILLLTTQSEEAAQEVLAQLDLIASKLDSLDQRVEALTKRISLFDPKTLFPEGVRPQTAPSDEDMRFEVAYLKQVARFYGFFQMLGVREMEHTRHRLSIAYVSLNLMGRGGTSVQPRNAGYVLSKERLVAVRGPAGSGKSTLLNWICLQCTRTEDQSNPWRHGVPFFVPLRRLNPDDAGHPDVRKLTEYTIDPTLWPLKPPDRWIYSILSQRRAILLLDGVDELPPPHRPAFWNWLREFIALYPRNRVYVTSRYFPDTGSTPSERLWNPPPLLHEADLLEMSDLDIADFINRWHDASIDQESDPRERLELQKARSILPDKLREPANRRVRDLCGTPLLCALVCALHWRDRGYLPKRRVDLYERCCEMLIEERDLKRSIAPPTGNLQYLGHRDKEMILQRLALDMMRNRSIRGKPRSHIEVSREEAARWVELSIASCNNELARQCVPDEVLDHLMERTGLLREPGMGRVDFTHRSFQEYLAACAAGAMNQAGDLARHAADDQWHETIILAAGTRVGGVPFGHALIRELVELGETNSRDPMLNRTYFALAVACLDTGNYIPKELRERVTSHLEQIVPPRDFEQARVLAAAGDRVVSLLDYQRHKDNESVTAACARTLALVGSRKAVRALLKANGYGNDGRPAVLEQICQCCSIHPLEVPYIVSRVVEFARPLPPLVRKCIAHVRDLRPICEWQKVQALNLSGCDNIADLTPLSAQTQIEHLELSHCRNIADIAPLASMTGLKVLVLDGCRRLRDLSPISALPGLKELYLRECEGVSGIGPLSKLVSLRRLYLNGCRQIRDVSPLASLSELEVLYLWGCTRIVDFAPLVGMRNLRRVGLSSGARDRIPPALMRKAYFAELSGR